jgi:hypothetical protein
MQSDSIKIGSVVAKASILVLFLIPLVQIVLGCIVTHSSISLILKEPESFGFVNITILFTYFIHAPLFLLLLFFIRSLRGYRKGRVIVTYILLLFGFLFSGIYFIYWFIPFPWVKYFPSFVYAFLIPLMFLGFVGVLRTK